MNYRHIYMLIIEHAKSEEKLGLRKKGNGEYYERHHILPKSLFPLWETRKSNLVLLTAREHFFCHQLLTKIYPCNEMNTALFFMSSSMENKIGSREYSRVSEQYSQHIKELWQNPSYREKVMDSRTLAFKNMTKETRSSKSSKISKAIKSYRNNLSEEEKQAFAKNMGKIKKEFFKSEASFSTRKKLSLAKKNMTEEQKKIWRDKHRSTVENYTEEEAIIYHNNRSNALKHYFKYADENYLQEINKKRIQAWKNKTDYEKEIFSKKCRDRNNKNNIILKPLYKEARELGLVKGINDFRQKLKGVNIHNYSTDELINIIKEASNEKK